MEISRALLLTLLAWALAVTASDQGGFDRLSGAGTSLAPKGGKAVPVSLREQGKKLWEKESRNKHQHHTRGGRSGFFWRMRASLGLACAQATTLASQVFGKGNPRSRAGRPSVGASPPDSGSSSPHRASIYILFCLSLSFCLCSLEVTVTSLHPPRPCRIAVFSIKPASPLL